jgi:hypothetical protein
MGPHLMVFYNPCIQTLQLVDRTTHLPPKDHTVEFVKHTLVEALADAVSLYRNARIKQYHKENRALRTETAVNNTYDFGAANNHQNALVAF